MRMVSYCKVTRVRTIAIYLVFTEVITLAWPRTHLKPGNHTSTLQMDGFVICKHGLIMTHWYTICSQAYSI